MGELTGWNGCCWKATVLVRHFDNKNMVTPMPDLMLHPETAGDGVASADNTGTPSQ